MAMENPVFNREYIFKRSIFHCHVSLPEGHSKSWCFFVEYLVDRSIVNCFVNHLIALSFFANFSGNTPTKEEIPTGNPIGFRAGFCT